MSQVHPQARTTALVRAEIKASMVSQAELSSTYNVSVATVRKWHGRDDPSDRSHRPHKLSTTLSSGQEAIVVELRKTLPLDDLVVTRAESRDPAWRGPQA